MKEDKALFYHKRDFSMEKIPSNLMNPIAENFNRKMAKLRGVTVLEHSE